MEAVPGSGQLTALQSRPGPATVGPVNQWHVEHWRGTAADFHGFVPPSRRTMWVVELTGPAVVLGSTQAAESVDADVAAAMGVSVTRRHSGGGAVWLHPERSVWLDFTIPRGDPVWEDDVPSSMGWLGDVFRDALRGVQLAEVVDTPYDATPLARAVCFGGLAPGEVVTSGAKTVGISQRRTREGARFQCVAYTRWDVEEWVDVLADPGVRRSVRELQVAEIAVNADEFVRRVHSCLPG